MNTKRLLFLTALLLVILTLLSSSVPPAPPDKPTLAVLDFDGLGLSESETVTLTNCFRANLAQIGQYTIIERGLMEEILAEQDFQMTGCTTDECAVKIGRLMNAQFILAGSIGKVGSTWTVEMRIINVETGAIEKTAFYDTQGAIDLMLTEGMEAAAQRIADKEAAIPAGPTPVTGKMVHKLTAPDAQAGDWFGVSVALSAQYTIVGASGGFTNNVGAAYVFRRKESNSWDTGTKLIAHNDQTGDRFGISVAVSGNYAIVGAHFDDAYAGAAYVFRRTGANSWDTGTKLTAPDAQHGDWFGVSVALSAEYAIIGAIGEDAGGRYAGAAYIFRRTGADSWNAGTKLTAPDAQTGDCFGSSVGLSGNCAIVGGFGTINAGGDNTGAAYIFRRTGANNWDAGPKLTSPYAQTGDNFGSSVGLSGNYDIVGALENEAEGANAGAAYVFRIK